MSLVADAVNNLASANSTMSFLVDDVMSLVEDGGNNLFLANSVMS